MGRLNASLVVVLGLAAPSACLSTPQELGIDPVATAELRSVVADVPSLPVCGDGIRAPSEACDDDVAARYIED